MLKGLRFFFVCLSNLLFIQQILIQQGFGQSKLDSLLTILDSNLTIIERINTLNKISEHFLNVDNDSSMHYARQAYFLAHDNDYIEGQADALNNMGEVFSFNGDFELALKLYLASKKKSEQNRYFSGIGRALNNIARIKNWQGKFDESINLSFLAIRYFQYVNNYAGIAKAYNTIGIAFDQSDNIEKARLYYHKSLEMFYKLNDLQGIANTLNNLAILFGKENNLDESLKLFKQSLQISKELKNQQLQTTILNNIGNIFKKQKKFKDAEICFQETKKINTEAGNIRGMMYSFLNLAGLYYEQKNYDLAATYYIKSSEIAENIQSLPELIECYEGLSNIYELQGDFKNSLFYYKKYNEASDRFQKERVKHNIEKTEQKHLLENKQSELELQKKDNEILRLELEKSVWLKNFILGILISVIALLIMFFFQYKSKMQTNRYLETLNKELSETNMKLVESESKLKELNATKDKFFSIISHDLRNPFASLVSFVRIMSRDYKNMTHEEMLQLMDEMKRTIEKTQDLLENLLLWSKTQTGKIVFQPEFFNLYEAVNENVQLFQGAIVQKQISVNVFIENPKMVYGDYNMIKTIIRNLLSNAIKFTNIKGNIKIYFKENQDYDIIVVEDDGVGMKKEDIPLLFVPGGKKSCHGTADEKGSGIGLLICREFIEKHKGYFEVQSELNKGSSFAIFLPKHRELI